MKSQSQSSKFIREILTSLLERNKQDLQIHDLIKQAIKKHDGKKITARIEKDLPEGFKYVVRAGMLHVHDKSDRSHLIAYDTNPVFDSVKFDEFDSWSFSGSKGRIAQLEGILNNPSKLEKMETVFTLLKGTFENFCGMVKEIEGSELEVYHNPAYYELLQWCGVPYKLVSDIKYNKLLAND